MGTVAQARGFVVPQAVGNDVCCGMRLLATDVTRGELARRSTRALPHPEHGFYAVPKRGPHAALAARYLDAMHNAANFAFGNRLFLGLASSRS